MNKCFHYYDIDVTHKRGADWNTQYVNDEADTHTHTYARIILLVFIRLKFSFKPLFVWLCLDVFLVALNVALEFCMVREMIVWNIKMCVRILLLVIWKCKTEFYFTFSLVCWWWDRWKRRNADTNHIVFVYTTQHNIWLVWWKQHMGSAHTTQYSYVYITVYGWVFTFFTHVSFAAKKELKTEQESTILQIQKKNSHREKKTMHRKSNNEANTYTHRRARK